MIMVACASVLCTALRTALAASCVMEGSRQSLQDLKVLYLMHLGTPTKPAPVFGKYRSLIASGSEVFIWASRACRVEGL